MSQGIGESSTFILEYAQKESCLGDVLARRIASQGFESSFFAEIILETIGLLEGFGGLLLARFVIRQHALVMPGRLVQLLGFMMHAGQEEASVRAECRIGKGGEHVERSSGGQEILEEKARVSVIIQAEISPLAFLQSGVVRVFTRAHKGSGERLSFLWL